MTDPDTPNEILAHAKAAKDQATKVAEKTAGKRSWPLAKIGIGAAIGSAAVAAAVLFANTERK